jgi:hypothetical protein
MPALAVLAMQVVAEEQALRRPVTVVIVDDVQPATPTIGLAPSGV